MFQRYEVLMATPALSHWDVKVGGTSMEEMRGACFAGSAPPFRGRERAADDIDVCPERRSPRYHETCLALESVEESSAAVGNLWPALHLQSVNT